jgi:hypothetical protein
MNARPAGPARAVVSVLSVHAVSVHTRITFALVDIVVAVRSSPASQTSTRVAARLTRTHAVHTRT